MQIVFMNSASFYLKSLYMISFRIFTNLIFMEVLIWQDFVEHLRTNFLHAYNFKNILKSSIFNTAEFAYWY